MSVSTTPSICPSDNDSMKGRTRSNSINITSWEHNMEDRNLPVSVASVHPREQITESLHPPILLLFTILTPNNNSTTHDTTRHPTRNTRLDDTVTSFRTARHLPSRNTATVPHDAPVGNMFSRPCTFTCIFIKGLGIFAG